MKKWILKLVSQWFKTPQPTESVLAKDWFGNKSTGSTTNSPNGQAEVKYYTNTKPAIPTYTTDNNSTAHRSAVQSTDTWSSIDTTCQQSSSSSSSGTSASCD